MWAFLRRMLRKPDVRADTDGPEAEQGRERVHGERGVTLARRSRSLQGRVNALLAGGCAIGVLVSLLVWYYRDVLPASGRHATASATASSHAGHSGPPPLGAIPPPRWAEPLSDQSPAHRTARFVAQNVGARMARVPLRSVRRVHRRSNSTRGVRANARQGRVQSTAHRAKALGGGVFIRARSAQRSHPSAALAVPIGSNGSDARDAPSRARGATLGALLHPTILHATRAELLPERRLLLAKGTSIDCTLETAIDSTLPGMTTCITATDTFSADGTVVLLARGTELIGQTRGRVRRGMARVFVIWTEARTPSGVVVRLDSPATDALGRSGLTGTVDRHFWQRFGAALLVSTLTGVVQSQVERSGGTVLIDPTASEDVVAQVLRGAEQIPPTIEVPNGQRIEVLVARDVNFRSVYELVTH